MSEVLSFGRNHIRHFAINGNEEHAIDLDTTDTGILTRWEQTENELMATISELDTIGDGDGENEREKAVAMSRRFGEVEAKAREQIDFLFNTNVSGPICAEYGNLLRTVDGEPFIMTVMETLLGFYAEDIRKDMEESKARIEKHTKKYLKK